MNLLLHGIETPHVIRDNALRKPLNEIGEKDRYDVIVTNPPFGGEEEAGIQFKFPRSHPCQRDGVVVYAVHHALA